MQLPMKASINLRAFAFRNGHHEYFTLLSVQTYLHVFYLLSKRVIRCSAKALAKLRAA